MKASLTNESTGAVECAVDMTDTMTALEQVVYDGLTMTPWREALPTWREALPRLSGATFYHSERGSKHCVTLTGWSWRSVRCPLKAAARRRGLRALEGIVWTPVGLAAFLRLRRPLALDDESRVELLRALACGNQATSIEIRGRSGARAMEERQLLRAMEPRPGAGGS